MIAPPKQEDRPAVRFLSTNLTNFTNGRGEERIKTRCLCAPLARFEKFTSSPSPRTAAQSS